MREYISKNYYATEFGFHFFREAFNELELGFGLMRRRFAEIIDREFRKLREKRGGGVPEKRQQKSKATKAAALPASIHEKSFSFRRRQWKSLFQLSVVFVNRKHFIQAKNIRKCCLPFSYFPPVTNTTDARRRLFHYLEIENETKRLLEMRFPLRFQC